MSVEISGAPEVAAGRLLSGVPRQGVAEKLVVPGNQVSATQGFMRGHGTYLRGDELIASLAGTVQQVNRLITVKSIKSRYGGEVGDVVVGRVIDVQQKRWKIDMNARLDGTLQLSSVNLPGGELRRKSVEDELMMREYLREGDLISAEVQQVSHDGTCSLHTRNLRYGKLAQGIMVTIPSYLVRRCKSHFHSLPCGAAVVVGCNGMVWIAPQLSEDPDGGYNQDLDEVIGSSTRDTMARLANCVRMLAAHCVSVYDTTITTCHDLSLRYTTKELLRPEVATEIIVELVQKLQAELVEM